MSTQPAVAASAGATASASAEAEAEVTYGSQFKRVSIFQKSKYDGGIAERKKQVDALKTEVSNAVSGRANMIAAVQDKIAVLSTKPLQVDEQIKEHADIDPFEAVIQRLRKLKKEMQVRFRVPAFCSPALCLIETTHPHGPCLHVYRCRCFPAPWRRASRHSRRPRSDVRTPRRWSARRTTMLSPGFIRACLATPCW